MGEIPEDIRKAVDELMDEYAAPNYRPILRGRICAAILAERQRCMRKVNEETNGATDEAVLISALAIQHAIAGRTE